MKLYELIKENFLSRVDNEAARSKDFSLMYVDEDTNQSVVVSVKNGEVEIREEENFDADLSITSSLEVFSRIIHGDTTGVDSYMEGNLELEGDRSMLEMQFEVFGIV